MTVATLLSEFDQEMATRKILECVPEDKFSWRPHEPSSTLEKLANHLAAMREALLRTRVMSHMIQRGQLSVYLRLPDVAVPGIYGPSVDEK